MTSTLEMASTRIGHSIIAFRLAAAGAAVVAGFAVVVVLSIVVVGLVGAVVVPYITKDKTKHVFNLHRNFFVCFEILVCVSKV